MCGKYVTVDENRKTGHVIGQPLAIDHWRLSIDYFSGQVPMCGKCATVDENRMTGHVIGQPLAIDHWQLTIGD